jgi:hypothetical protein
MKYETMTCTGKAISKVMGWGVILKMIRDNNMTQEMVVGTVKGGTDREHQVFLGFDAIEWRAKAINFIYREVVEFIYIGA